MMNRKIIDMLFILILISAPLKFANQILTVPVFIGGWFARDFVIWPLLLGFIYTLYCQLKYGDAFYEWHKFKKYIVAYVVILFISLTWGFLNYPYWDMFFNGQAINNAKFASALGILNKAGFNIEENTILSFWLVLKFAKNIILNVFYTFGGAYMIFCWYHGQMRRAIQLLKNATLGLLVVIAAYGVVDICYQNGQMWAQNFISVMWPILHTNPEGAYFPMFLGARNRSLFLEASYFAIYMAFAFPILWWKIVESKGKVRIGLVLLYLLLACEIYLGQSRTGMALFWGELLLLSLVAVFKKNRKLFISTICLFIGAAISFGGSIYFLQHLQVPARIGERTPLATKKIEILKSKHQEKVLLASKKAEILQKKSQEKISSNNKKEQIVQDKKHKEKTLSNTKKTQIIHDKNPVTAVNKQVKSYLDDSLLSLFDKEKAKKRGSSNYVRFGITIANIEIGLKQPLLGVGPGLDTAYLYEIFKNDDNREIKRFVKTVEKKGLLNSSSPFMCEYTAQFMQVGFLGLFLFILPMGYVIVCFLRRLFKKIEDEKIFYTVLFITLADIGISITGFGNTVNITYCYWLMIGVSYVVELTLRKREQYMLV